MTRQLPAQARFGHRKWIAFVSTMWTVGATMTPPASMKPGSRAWRRNWACLVFLPYPSPEQVAKATSTFGENGYGKETDNPVDVDFPLTRITKYASSVLQESLPLALFVAKYTLSDLIINDLIRLYFDTSNDTNEPDPEFRAACNWLKANYDTWKLWLDRAPLCTLSTHMEYQVRGCENGSDTRSQYELLELLIFGGLLIWGDAGHMSEEGDVKQRVVDALHRPENAHCADCNAPSPKCVLVLLKGDDEMGGDVCAGVHRSLGVHVSFVLSCTLDKWTDAQVRVVETVGNDALNELMEYSVPHEFQKPNADTLRPERERYIRAKYEDELFKASPSKKKQQAISSSSFATSNLSPPASSTALVPPSGTGATTPTNHGMVEYIGVLMIELIEGTNLAGMDINGKSDPYVTFHLGEQSITSSRVSNSINPQWGQTLMLSWDGSSPLIAEIFDHNKISSDRSMGRVIVDKQTLEPLTVESKARAELQALDSWFQVVMPREWATNFGEHMVAGAEGMGKGLYKGITGVWKDPIKGAKENGLEGFAKGMGKGVAGIVYRPIKGLGSMVKQTALSVGVGKKHRSSSCEELVEAGSLHLKLSLQRF